MQPYRRITIAVGVSMFVDASLYLAVLPLLPRYADQFNLNTFQAGLVLAAYPVSVPFVSLGCIVLVLAFRSSDRLAAAYGIAVTGTMAITSIVYYIVTRETWGWSRGKAMPLLVLFLAFDGAFVWVTSAQSNAVSSESGGIARFMVP